ncbi:synaptic vesicle glycoprotein 2A-like [Belonocnema kinseyi]|uniref:synaptic vesicle glycoprotein 2A-like n=1 Tax=Belonocnema kinseyi TaxID=2817044 RepID=UPI00143D0DAB|nr:synaptic vesicle glycoprotein 2A-like [Belonocnema kinseyi]
MAWILGLFCVPLLAWIIMPLEIEYVTGSFSFRSWNLFILICSLPASLIATCLLFFPETPKFLANSQQYSKLLKVLTEMYESNTGKAAKDFLITLPKDGNPFTDEMIRLFLNNKKLKIEKSVHEKNLNVILDDLKSQAINVFHSNYMKKMIIASVATFFIMSPYNTLILWFPEILERFARFENRYPNETSSVCTVSQRKGLFNTSLSNVPIGCDRTIDNSVYVNTLWLSAACAPPAILLPLLVDKVGFRFFLVPASVIGCLATLGLFFVKSSLQNMIISCIFESATSIGISIIYCCLVVIFPTNFRVFAVTVAALTGRIGGFVGNLIFSLFIDDYCVPVILSVAIQLLLGAVLCYIL